MAPTPSRRSDNPTARCRSRLPASEEVPLTRRSAVDGSTRKHLALARIAEIKAAANCFLTLHGGSGTGDEDFVGAIRAGINIIHVNTELPVAWRRGLEKGLAADSSEVVPYKILPSAIAAVEGVVKSRLRLFTESS